MLRRLSYLCCVVLIVCYAAVGQGAQEDAAVIYSNFGPGMTFDTEPFHAWTINRSAFGGHQAIAQKFTPQTTNTFRGAHVVLSLFSGTGIVDVFLQADENGLPGSVLEQITVSELTSAPTIVTATSVQHPTLLAGTPYWLSVVAGPEPVLAGWHWNSIGDVSTADNCASTQGGSPLGPWSPGCFVAPGPDGIRSAFQINGDAPTAEDRLELLLDNIEALLVSDVLTEDQADGLMDKIEAAIGSLQRGNVLAACNQLRAFVNQVAAFISAGVMPAVRGEDLIDAAEAIRTEIGC